MILSKNRREGGEKGQNVADLWEDRFKELDAAVDTIYTIARPPELRMQVNMRRKQYHISELTCITEGKDKRVVQLPLYITEVLPTPLRVIRSPKLVVNIGRAQSPGPCLSKFLLHIPNKGL